MTRQRLKVRIAELRAQADARRRLAQGCQEERWSLERAAREAIKDAHQFEREAEMIEATLLLIDKADGEVADVPEAARYLRKNPLADREARIFEALAGWSEGALAEIPWRHLTRITRLPPKELRDGLATLAHMGFIDPLRRPRGGPPTRWLLLKSAAEAGRAA